MLDLRGAAYGAPAEGVKVAELFLQGGVVAKLSARGTSSSCSADPAQRRPGTGPLAVLVDNGTAGPGEIVAAALLDAGRGESSASTPSAGRRSRSWCPCPRAAWC